MVLFCSSPDSRILSEESLEFISRDDSVSPYFLYFAPDSTHGPTYASKKFNGRSTRGSAFGDAVMEIDWSVGQMLDYIKKRKRQGGGSRQ